MNFITQLRIFIKKRFPKTYAKLRKKLFRFEKNRRQRAASSFTTPVTKQVEYAGHSFLINLNPNNGFVDRNIYTNGVYEPDILTVIKTELPHGGTFVDIGANIGQHSLFACSVVGSEGTVVAFEPIPSIIQQFQSSVSKNNFTDRCTIHPVGCSDKLETKSLQLVATNMGGSSMHDMKDESSASIDIQLDTADTRLNDLPNIDLIKIDTEGHEYEVLQGLSGTIARLRPKILMEFSPTFRKDISGLDVFHVLEKNNYRYFDLEDGHKEIVDLQQWTDNFTKRQTNLLCISR